MKEALLLHPTTERPLLALSLPPQYTCQLGLSASSISACSSLEPSPVAFVWDKDILR